MDRGGGDNNNIINIVPTSTTTFTTTTTSRQTRTSWSNHMAQSHHSHTSTGGISRSGGTSSTSIHNAVSFNSSFSGGGTSSSLSAIQQHTLSDSEDQSPRSRRSSRRSGGSGSGDIPNLVLMRNSKLGQSAPTLSISLKEQASSGGGSFGSVSAGGSSSSGGGVSGSCCIGHGQRKYGHTVVTATATSTAQHRRSIVVSNTSPTFPRCHSPMTSSSSPIDSPKILHTNRQFPFIPLRRPFTHLSAECKDGRRWSVASLPSSGYDTNSGSSNVSSQCSSQERLHHLPNLPTSDALQILNEHFSSNDCNTTNTSTDDDVAGYGSGSGSTSSGATATTLAVGRSPLAATTSATSTSTATPNIKGGSSGSSGGGTRKYLARPRSRSLSSPNRSPCQDTDIVTLNMLYKERFPNAMRQMEQRLDRFIDDDQMVLAENLKECSPDAAPIIRFVHHQILEMARDCLKTSQEKLITRSYFYEISENLEKLLIETKEKSPEGAIILSSVVKKLLLIISRPARLLECLEFDPEAFYHFLEEEEGQAKSVQGIKADIPRYIINKLGIDKDPIEELEEDLHGSTSSSSLLLPIDSCESLASLSVSSCEGGGGSSGGDKETFSKKIPCEEDFEVIKLVSKGAYGSVYLVRHHESRQRFALKKIIKHSIMLRNQIEQVFAERDIMSFTDNPFVVSMYCSFETRKYLCLVMEYVEGGDCASLLKSIGPLPPNMAKFYFAETVLAVEYLHSYGIVHRDLKPDNLLITAFGHIKLTDFGLSKMGLMSLATHLYEVYIDKDTKQFSDKQVYGTPEYIAPEVILRQGYGKPVDWWSMGIILYEFLIGCVPFFGETPEELFAHTVNDDIEWPDDEDWPIRAEAKDLISTLLQQNPRDRLGTSGAHEVKEHGYFVNVDWDSLLRQKAEFVPQLSGEEDTSYFDSRVDRFKHEIMEQTDDSDESYVLGSFTSCLPNFRKATSRQASCTSDSTPEISALSTGKEDVNSTITSSIVSSQVLPSPLTPIKLPPPPPPQPPPPPPPLPPQQPSNLPSNHPRSHVDHTKATGAFARRENIPKFSISIDNDGDISDSQESLPLFSFNEITSSVTSPPAQQTNINRDLFPSTLVDLGSTQLKMSKVTMSSLISALPTLTDGVNATAKISTITTTVTAISTTSTPSQQTPLLSETQLPLTRTAPATPYMATPVTMAITPTSSVADRRHQRRMLAAASAAAAAAAAAADESTDSSTLAVVRQHHKSRSLMKSSSSSGLALFIPSDEGGHSIQSPGGSSTASSRDTSPCQELSPLISNLKPPIVIRRGAAGFGFTVHTVRVYLGETYFYTMHHLVMEVDVGSPAYEAGLRANDLITHINGQPVQGLFHTQVLQLLLCGGDKVTLRATPLENTSIRNDGKKREPNRGKLAARKPKQHHKKSSRKEASSGSVGSLPTIAGSLETRTKKNSKSSISARLQKQQQRRAANDVAASAAAVKTPPATPTDCLSPSMTPPSLQPQLPLPQSLSLSSSSSSSSLLVPLTPDYSSNSSSSSSSNSPSNSSYQRPSSLHGLKHKLAASQKNLHSNNRRKSVGHIPLSPLARTPSPSPIPASPTRSPSPLIFPPGHHPAGSSNTTQSYSPSAVCSPMVSSSAVVVKKNFGRAAKNAEARSPLFRRALSPDRLHPRPGDPKNNFISPLCDPELKVVTMHAPRITVTSKSPPIAAVAVASGKSGFTYAVEITSTVTSTSSTTAVSSNASSTITLVPITTTTITTCSTSTYCSSSSTFLTTSASIVSKSYEMISKSGFSINNSGSSNCNDSCNNNNNNNSNSNISSSNSSNSSSSSSSSSSNSQIVNCCSSNNSNISASSNVISYNSCKTIIGTSSSTNTTYTCSSYNSSSRSNSKSGTVCSTTPQNIFSDSSFSSSCQPVECSSSSSSTSSEMVRFVSETNQKCLGEIGKGDLLPHIVEEKEGCHEYTSSTGK